MRSDYLKGALNGFILTHVQGLDELLDLVLAASILSLPPGQLLPLLCEVGVLVQRLLVHMAARYTSSQLMNIQAPLIAELLWEVGVLFRMAGVQGQPMQPWSSATAQLHSAATWVREMDSINRHSNMPLQQLSCTLLPSVIAILGLAERARTMHCASSAETVWSFDCSKVVHIVSRCSADAYDL